MSGVPSAAASPSGALLGKRYLLQDVLGRGGMGVVHRASDRLTRTTVAVKRLVEARERSAPTAEESEFRRLALAREFRVLASLRHPNVISVLDYGFDDERRPYFAMELLEEPSTILDAAEGRTPPCAWICWCRRSRPSRICTATGSSTAT